MEWCRDKISSIVTECGLDQRIYVTIELFMSQQNWSRLE